MIRTVIVDDESKSCNVLKKILTTYCEGVQVVGMAHSGGEGKELIEREKPQLAFVDIQMPDMDGFQMLQNTNSNDAQIVFVSAYDSFALPAFRYSPLDYLLKPVNIDDLSRALERCRQHLLLLDKEKRRETIATQPLISSLLPLRIAIGRANEIQFIEIDSIIRMEADRNYTVFYLQDKSTMVTARTLGEYEAMLHGLPFLRVHQSHLINLSKVVRFVKGKEGYAVMCDGSHVRVSAQKREEFLAKIAIH